MSLKRFFHREPFPTIEAAIMAVFVSLVLVILILNPSQGTSLVEDVPPSEIIQAYAYAMPAEGWSPLKEYFSAFRSTSNVGRTIRLEWDLGGNGCFETEVAEEGGYVIYLYKKSGINTIALRVSNELGNIATDNVIVTVIYAVIVGDGVYRLEKL